MKAGAGRAYDAELPFYFQGQQINERAMHLVDSSLFVPGALRAATDVQEERPRCTLGQ